MQQLLVTVLLCVSLTARDIRNLHTGFLLKQHTQSMCTLGFAHLELAAWFSLWGSECVMYSRRFLIR
jgi:hypothetical protein